MAEFDKYELIPHDEYVEELVSMIHDTIKMIQDTNDQNDRRVYQEILDEFYRELKEIDAGAYDDVQKLIAANSAH